MVRLRLGERTRRPRRVERVAATALPQAHTVPAASLPQVPAQPVDCGGGATASATPDRRYDALWSGRGPGWTGGDGTYSVRLPDGRELWLFGDTFLGRVDAGRARSRLSPMVRNVAVLQTGDALTTLVRGSPRLPRAFAEPRRDGSEWYWPAAAVVEGDALRVFLARFARTGDGQWSWRYESGAIATLSLPDLRIRSSNL